MVVEEAFGLVIRVIGGSFLLDAVVLAALSATEEDSPDEDDEVSDNHSDKASGDSDNHANHDRNEDVENNASEEAGKATMSVMMAVWAVGTMRTRTSMAVWSHSRAVLGTVSTWTRLSCTSLYCPLSL